MLHYSNIIEIFFIPFERNKKVIECTGFMTSTSYRIEKKIYVALLKHLTFTQNHLYKRKHLTYLKVEKLSITEKG